MPLPGPRTVEEPHQELRFTRGAQGARFAILGALLAGAAIATLLLNVIPKDPITPLWWPLVPVPFAVVSWRLAWRCVRHAYVILTPLGIEVFPFFKARENLRVIYWSDIADAEINARGDLVLHFNENRSAGVVASLAPLLPAKRSLLARAVEGRMKETGATDPPDC